MYTLKWSCGGRNLVLMWDVVIIMRDVGNLKNILATICLNMTPLFHVLSCPVRNEKYHWITLRYIKYWVSDGGRKSKAEGRGRHIYLVGMLIWQNMVTKVHHGWGISRGWQTSEISYLNTPPQAPSHGTITNIWLCYKASEIPKPKSIDIFSFCIYVWFFMMQQYCGIGDKYRKFNHTSDLECETRIRIEHGIGPAPYDMDTIFVRSDAHTLIDAHSPQNQPSKYISRHIACKSLYYFAFEACSWAKIWK